MDLDVIHDAISYTEGLLLFDHSLQTIVEDIGPTGSVRSSGYAVIACLKLRKVAGEVDWIYFNPE